jgi:hypothetical protein
MNTNYNVELTDLFGGEANYSWVKRELITIKSRKSGESFNQWERRLVRAAKASLGLTGVRCRKEWLGETLALYPIGSQTVVFIY